MDKQQLKILIREWMQLDEESTSIKKKIKQINQSKKEISSKLLAIMKSQEIDEFDLNQEGKLIRKEKKTKASLNKKQLNDSLFKYYNNEVDAKKATDFILSTRLEKISETLCKKV